MAAVIQLNTRLDAQLKRQGDRVLVENGLTPSIAVRRLWTYLAERGELPEFMRDDEQEKSRRAMGIKAGAGLAWRAAGLSQPEASADDEDGSDAEATGAADAPARSNEAGRKHV